MTDKKNHIHPYRDTCLVGGLKSHLGMIFLHMNVFQMKGRTDGRTEVAIHLWLSLTIIQPFLSTLFINVHFKSNCFLYFWQRQRPLPFVEIFFFCLAMWVIGCERTRRRMRRFAEATLCLCYACSSMEVFLAVRLSAAEYVSLSLCV